MLNRATSITTANNKAIMALTAQLVGGSVVEHMLHMRGTDLGVALVVPSKEEHTPITIIQMITKLCYETLKISFGVSKLSFYM